MLTTSRLNETISLTKKQWGYLLPVPAMKDHLFCQRYADPKPDKYYFTGEPEQIADMYRRLAYLD